MQRRQLLQHGLALGLTPAFLAQSVFAQNTAGKAQVVVIGGGYATHLPDLVYRHSLLNRAAQEIYGQYRL
jgi:uncharacterized protein (DUF1501 family)